ncbi:MAG: hypothetical protein U1F02_02955 [Cellvibrio sp.]
MKLKIVFFLVIFLSSCVGQPLNESARNTMKLKCQGLPIPQRNECLADIPPEYNKYQEDR